MSCEVGDVKNLMAHAASLKILSAEMARRWTVGPTEWSWEDPRKVSCDFQRSRARNSLRIEDIVHSLEYIERMSHVPIFARRNEAEVWLKQHMYEDILNCFWIEIARLERMQKQVYNGFWEAERKMALSFMSIFCFEIKHSAILKTFCNEMKMTCSENKRRSVFVVW